MITKNEQVEDDEFINIFYTLIQEQGETSSHHVDSSNMHTFYQRHRSEHRWTKDHSLKQVIGNPSQSIRTRRQLEIDGEMLLQFKRLDVWVLVPAPDNITPLTLKWLFKNKYDEENTVIRNMTRLVVRRHRQEEGIDFEESFALVARMEAIGIFLAYVAHKSFTVFQMDMKTAFFHGTIDPTLFIRRFDDDILVVQVYVDDIIFGSTHPVNQSPCGIFINQTNYMLEILKIYRMEICDPVGTPMEIKDKIDLDQNETLVDAAKYHSMIGALMYLTSRRPGIIHATCLCAQYQAKPIEKHLKEVKRIFRYLHRIVNMGLWYTKHSGFELTGFSYADHAGCKDTFKSTFGGAQFLGEKLMDVKITFLYGPLKEEVYVNQPDGFIDPHHPNKFYHLKMALYGLKKAPRIHQSPRGSFINQAKYAQEILIKHGMTSCDSIGTPMATKHLDADLSRTSVDQTKYRTMVGALMYLTASRQDIVHATCYCAHYQEKPTKKHLTAVKRIFLYLKNTINIGLWYPKDTGFELTAFSDSDHAGYLDSRKSTSGGIQFLRDVPEIYIQEFWATTYVHQHSIKFKMDTRKNIVELESFREMLHISPRVLGKSFAELPFEEEILEFLQFLRHSAQIKTLTDVNVNKLFQPWRSFAAVINKCLTGKSTSFNSLSGTQESKEKQRDVLPKIHKSHHSSLHDEETFNP
nr:hypothetical protein [Tanacetum cinerariifolium]